MQDSLWFLPAVLTTMAAVLAVALMTAEEQGLLWAEGAPPGWLYQGGAEGARTVLSSITGSLITVTGVVFSVTMVAVQLASSQYTPRVLRDFSSDRGIQAVLGIFIATFTYGLIVMRTIRSPEGEGEEMVPRLAITVAVVLLMVSVVALIYFIHHLAREMQVTAIIDRITKETVRNVHRLFPEQVGRADDPGIPDPRLPEHPSVTVCAPQAGYLQAVDEESLYELGEREQIVIGMEPAIGDYVLQGRPLAAVRAGHPLAAELEEAIARAFVLGPERTPYEDVEFGMVQISDIAVKALSPSINDPTTAVRCIDRLAEILVELGQRRPPEPRRTKEGVVHFIASYATFERAVKVALDEIRHFGAATPLIAEHLIHTIAELVALLPTRHREPLVSQARAVLHTARREIRNPRDVEQLDRAVELLSQRLGFPVDSTEPESGAEG